MCIISDAISFGKSLFKLAKLIVSVHKNSHHGFDCLQRAKKGVQKEVYKGAKLQHRI